MKHESRTILLVPLLVLFVGTSVVAQAESAIATESVANMAVARLKLRVVVPRFLHFRVGAANRVDTLSFDPAADLVGDRRVVAGSGGSSGSGSAADVELRSNAGQITITEENDGGAGGLGFGGRISLTDVAAQSDSAALQAPQLTDGGGNAVSVPLTGGDITVRKATWTYHYTNRRVAAPGTYRAHIVYTAVSP
jgi:hypothetical protein